MSKGPGQGIRLLRGVLLVAAALAPPTAPAHATPFAATLSLVIDSAIGTLGAVSFMGSGSGTSLPASVTVSSDLFSGAALLPVAGVASLSAVSIQVSGNLAGRFVNLDGRMPISGALLLKGSLGAGPATLVKVPLRVTFHRSRSTAASVGLGRYGSLGRFDSPLWVRFQSWDTGTAGVSSVPWGMTYSYHVAAGPAASHRSFFNYTVATGSDARTPGGLGQVTLVSPTRVRTHLPGTGSLLVVFGTLTLNFVPEPGTLALLGAGVAALGLLGRRRLRRLS